MTYEFEDLAAMVRPKLVFRNPLQHSGKTISVIDEQIVARDSHLVSIDIVVRSASHCLPYLRVRIARLNRLALIVGVACTSKVLSRCLGEQLLLFQAV